MFSPWDGENTEMAPKWEREGRILLFPCIKNDYIYARDRPMIAYLNGELTYKSPSMVHVEVNGVGYEVQISLHTYDSLAGLERCRLHTYQHFREDGQTLYGFHEASEREMFLHLIGISGVGAATARMMLSSLRPEEIARAIASSDSRTLERVKGIGRKTAERIVLELKERMQKTVQSFTAGGSSTSAPSGLEQDALQALVALGIPRTAAEAALKKSIASLPGETRVEAIIKNALQVI
jgi:Holliday junction DNA helicase RuvA